MAGEWETTSLGDICTGIYDGPHATPPPSETGAVFLRIENITRSGRLDFSDIRRINDADLSHWTRRVTPQPDDVVFSYEANLGLFARIPPGFHGCLGRRLALMRPNPSQVDAGYLLYACLAPAFQELLRQRTVLGSTVDRISLREFPSFEIPLPPLPEQKRIAHVLGALDDKIELNRRMNATLEGISRAIFKSWFVDFDPVRQKAAGQQPVGMDAQTAALFPDSFEDSEIGEVPKGWPVQQLGTLIELAYGKALKEEDRQRGDVPVFGSNGQVGLHDQSLVRGPGIVVGRKGNPGVIVWAASDFFPIDTTFYVVPKDSAPNLFFLFYALQGQNLASLSADSAVPGLNRNLAYMSNQLVPPISIADAFEVTARQVFAAVEANLRQSSRLAALRDTLLPKLLSGEIRVPEAEQTVEEAIA